MRSEIKKYDMFKAGEYIKDSTQEDLEYFRLIDKIPDIDLRLKILRLTDKINARTDLMIGLGVLIFCILFFAFGFTLGYSYKDIITILSELKP